MTHEQCIAPLKARTHLIFYPDKGWGRGAGRYMWMDEQGRLLYFRYHGNQDEITDYRLFPECTEAAIRQGFYALEDSHLRSFKEFGNMQQVERLQNAHEQYLAVLTELISKPTVVQIAEKNWLGYHPLVGYSCLEIFLTTQVVTKMHFGHEKQLLSALLKNPALGTTPYPNEWKEIALPYFQYIEKTFEQLQSDSEMRYGLFRLDKDNNGTCYSFFEGRWMGMPLLNGQLDESRLMNPYAFLSDAEEITNWLQKDYFNKNYKYYKLELLSSAQTAALPKMATAFKKTKQAVLDDYIVAFKNGLSISMGPTTDQTWTIYFEKGQFWTRSYEPQYDPSGNPNGYEQVISPYTEEKVREVLSRYKMFGLWRVGD